MKSKVEECSSERRIKIFCSTIRIVLQILSFFFRRRISFKQLSNSSVPDSRMIAAMTASKNVEKLGREATPFEINEAVWTIDGVKVGIYVFLEHVCSLIYLRKGIRILFCTLHRY